MPLTKQQQKDLKVLIEVFWDFESGWGAGLIEKAAAVRLQKAAGYKTAWDEQRLKSCTLNELEYGEAK